MVRVYSYNDLNGFSRKQKSTRSNLCTWYYRDKEKFCGNYCSRKTQRFNRYCWLHTKKVGSVSKSLPPLVLIMISSSDRTYNRDIWLRFLLRCKDYKVPIELVYYHEDVFNCTVRESHNMLSRYRPFPDIFGSSIPIKNRHGSVNFTQSYLKMLEYTCKIPLASRCIVLTERTIPIRSPVYMYRRALASKCHIDISYNVGFGPVPKGLPRGPRNKAFEGVNNLCQGLFTVEFLKLALPTVPRQCERFGMSMENGVLHITDTRLFEQWRGFTGANPSEFLLLNSYLLDTRGKMKDLQRFMEKTNESDKYTVAEVPQYRADWKRTFVFKDPYKLYDIPMTDRNVARYYRGLHVESGVSLVDIIRFIITHKPRALFFRQVELP